jgi:hypothetical protein
MKKWPSFLAGVLLARYPALLASRYGLPGAELAKLDAADVIERIAMRRGLRLRGGDADLEKQRKCCCRTIATACWRRRTADAGQSSAAGDARQRVSDAKIRLAMRVGRRSATHGG